MTAIELWMSESRGNILRGAEDPLPPLAWIVAGGPATKPQRAVAGPD